MLPDLQIISYLSFVGSYLLISFLYKTVYQLVFYFVIYVREVDWLILFNLPFPVCITGPWVFYPSNALGPVFQTPALLAQRVIAHLHLKVVGKQN